MKILITMKKILIVGMLMALLTLAGNQAFSQGAPPPPPSGGHGLTGNQPPAGGNAPVGGGMMLLIGLGSAWALRKSAQAGSETAE